MLWLFSLQGFFGACMCKERIAVPAEVWGQRELRFEQIPFTSIYQLQTRAFSLDKACVFCSSSAK
jgi:hypothetical protein